MRTCKVKPSASVCGMCADTSDYFDHIPDCSKCIYKAKTYELIEVVSGFFNDYAFVQSNGTIQKVSIDRVYDVKGE